nr:CDP-alcohol phosphatidyltransferase family protein [bacterium]
MTIPNILTTLRLLLVPVFAWCYFHVHPLVGLLIYALACLTDVCDGYIARKYNQISRFGQYADPVADKLMVVTVLACLTLSGAIHWIFVLIIAVKEMLMILGAAILYLKGNRKLIFPAKPIGKAATFGLFIAILAAFFRQWIAPWHTVLMAAAVALSLAAFFYYTVHNIREARQTP